MLSLNHLHLPARDPAGLSKWYIKYLNFTPQGNLLWSNGTLLVFGKGEPLNNKHVHFGFRFESAESLHRFHRELREKGLKAPEPKGDEEYECFRIKDPEGYEIEFFWEEIP
ncbi:MAG: VOC family protein [Cyanobacteria bacterium]|nr:VOC family protein [Cyanobacteriota bacterium]